MWPRPFVARLAWAPGTAPSRTDGLWRTVGAGGRKTSSEGPWSMRDLETRLTDILRRCPGLMAVMAVARDLSPPDWLIFSGAIYQPVWNSLTGRDLEHGVRDYDLAYFDSADISYEAEDEVIRRVAAAMPPALSPKVEVRNQARVHLWFEAHFGEPYEPLGCTADALERFAAPTFAVGARLEAEGEMTIVAPFGLDDLFAMTVRPNPRRTARGLPRIMTGLRARWPELTLLD